ncbi:recombinase RecT [Agromyces sp. SYSU T00194]|uniref:recombinase RecT n=1 Tax=Agromyces chitinivorans TaxID=3158560 RepID=UPI00339A1282
MSNSIALPQQDAVIQKVNAASNGFAAALADRIGADRFVRAAVTSIRTNRQLAQCDELSILGGLFVAAQLALEIGGPRGLAYLVPYGREAQLIVGYRGYVELFYRAGARKVEWFIVREGDEFRQWSTGSGGRDYQWTPLNTDTDRPLVGAVAQIQGAQGEFQFEYMSKAQINERRPKRATSGPWADWYEEMALKTVMRQLAKTARQSTDELALAASNDGAVITQVEGGPVRVVHPPTAEPEQPVNLDELDPLQATPEEEAERANA